MNFEKGRPPATAPRVWSRKLRKWVEKDTRSAERRAKDEALARSADADQDRLKEVLKEAEAIQSKRSRALSRAAESLTLSLFRELISARKDARLTQVQVADRMGVPQSAIVRLESGVHSPTLTTLSRYAVAVGVQLEVRRAVYRSRRSRRA
jgi:DNA-binding XRE family transcriptional regulator